MSELSLGIHPNNPERGPLLYDPDGLLTYNPHGLVCGASGSGKTTLIKKIISYFESKRKHIIVFDLKGDMNIVNSEGEKVGNYISITSWESEYGISPFEFDTGVDLTRLKEIIDNKMDMSEDEDFKIKNSGPKMQVERFIEIIKKNFLPNMSTNQKDVLAMLLLDTYKMKNIIYNKPETWTNELPSLNDTLTLLKQINMFAACEDEVTIYDEDIMDYNIRFIKISKMIDSNKEQEVDCTELEKELENLIGSFRKKIRDSKLNTKDTLTIEYYVSHGINLGDYNSNEIIRTLNKLSSYIKGLEKTGIFSAKKLPVKAGLNVINLSGLEVATQRFFVDVTLGNIFRACKIKGEYSKFKDKSRGDKVYMYVFIDESKLIAGSSKEKNDPYSYLNRIATESRAYGLGIFVAAQSAEHFPPEFLKNFYLQIILSTGVSDIDVVRKAFDINKELLKFTQNGWGNSLIKQGKNFNKIKLTL